MNIHSTIDKAINKLMELNISRCYDTSTLRDQMLWIPYALPKIVQSEKHLFFACISCSYLFYIDDVMEKYKDFNEIAIDIHKKRPLEYDGVYDYEVYGIVYYCEQLLQQTLNPYNYELFHEDLLAYLPTEDYSNKHVKFDGLQQYLTSRFPNIAIRPFLVILYDSLNLNYPIAYNEYFVRAIFCVTIINDLCSYSKEIKEEEPYNALLVLKQKNNKQSDNIAHLLDLANGYLSESFSIKDQLMSEILVSLQLGNTAWHAMSNRYKILHKAIIYGTPTQTDINNI